MFCRISGGRIYQESVGYHRGVGGTAAGSMQDGREVAEAKRNITRIKATRMGCIGMRKAICNRQVAFLSAPICTVIPFCPVWSAWQLSPLLPVSQRGKTGAFLKLSDEMADMVHPAGKGDFIYCFVGIFQQFCGIVYPYVQQQFMNGGSGILFEFSGQCHRVAGGSGKLAAPISAARHGREAGERGFHADNKVRKENIHLPQRTIVLL